MVLDSLRPRDGEARADGLERTAREAPVWGIEGEFCSMDRAVDHRAGLARLTVPLLLIPGRVDRVRPPAAVRRAPDHLPPRGTSRLEFGPTCGHAFDSDQADPILERAASAEALPAVARWRHEAAQAAVQEEELVMQ